MAGHSSEAPRPNNFLVSSPVQRQFWRNNLIVGVGNVAGQLQGLLLIPLVVKLSGPATYGAFALVSSLLLLTVTLSSLGIGYRYRRFLPATDEPSERAALFLPGVVGQTVGVALGALGVMMLFPWFARAFMRELPGFNPFWIPGYCLSYVFYNQACDYFRYTHRMAVFSGAVFATNTLGLLSYALLAVWGVKLNLTLLVAVQVACNTFSGVVLWIAVRREIPLRWRPAGLVQYAEDVRLGFPVILSTIAEMVTAVADRYVIAAWFSAEGVGLYAPAFTVGSLILFVPRISGVVLPPLLARATDRADAGTADRLVRANVRFFLLLAVPAIAGVAVIAVPVLEFLATAPVAAAGRWVVPLIAAASLSYGLAMILSGVLFVEKRTRVIFVANLAAGSCKVVLSIAALHFGLGLAGVAGATLVGAVTGLGIMMRGTTQAISSLFEWKFLAKLGLASALMASLVLWLQRALAGSLQGMPLVVALVGFGFVIYALGLLVLRAWPTTPDPVR